MIDGKGCDISKIIFVKNIYEYMTLFHEKRCLLRGKYGCIEGLG
jgi:hypothetical protein